MKFPPIWNPVVGKWMFSCDLDLSVVNELWIEKQMAPSPLYKGAGVGVQENMVRGRSDL